MTTFTHITRSRGMNATGGSIKKRASLSRCIRENIVLPVSMIGFALFVVYQFIATTFVIVS